MRSRGLVVAIAAVLAVVAAAAVVLYTNGVKNDAVTGGSLAVVVVSNQDIPANTELDPLIDDGAFGELQIPTDAVVDGAITTLEQLQGQTTTSPVLANEQIPVGRLSTGELPAGGALGISPGNVASSIRLNDDAAVAGAVTRGSWVTVYATYDHVNPVDEKSPQAGPGAGPSITLIEPMTVTLIPAVRVLEVVNPVAETEGGQPGTGDVTLTLDLTPRDSQDLQYALQTSTIRLALLPPKDIKGHPMPFSGVPLDRVLGRGGA